jgi:hypothetical protein
MADFFEFLVLRIRDNNFPPPAAVCGGCMNKSLLLCLAAQLRIISPFPVAAQTPIKRLMIDNVDKYLSSL